MDQFRAFIDHSHQHPAEVPYIHTRNKISEGWTLKLERKGAHLMCERGAKRTGSMYGGIGSGEVRRRLCRHATPQ